MGIFRILWKVLFGLVGWSSRWKQIKLKYFKTIFYPGPLSLMEKTGIFSRIMQLFMVQYELQYSFKDAVRKHDLVIGQKQS